MDCFAEAVQPAESLMFPFMVVFRQLAAFKPVGLVPAKPGQFARTCRTPSMFRVQFHLASAHPFPSPSSVRLPALHLNHMQDTITIHNLCVSSLQARDHNANLPADGGIMAA